MKYGLFFKKRLRQIKEYQILTIDEEEELKNELLIKHIKNAYGKSLFYKNLYNSYGVNLNQIQNKEDLVNLPIITKELIKDNVNDIYTGNKFIKHTSYTSGTTGSPLKVYYSLNCVLNEASYNEVFRNNAGHFYGDRVISLRGALNGKEKEYFDKFNNTLYLSSYHIKPENAKWYFEKINLFKPKTILAYPSSLEALSNVFLRHNLKVDIPLAFTSSETLYPHQQDKIEKTLDTKIFDRYGNAERTISLVQKTHRGEYIFPKLYSVNEFISEGEIFTTNLINREFPLIRYQVNDIIEVNRNNKVKQIGGRVDDCIITKDGLQIGSAAMSLAFKQVPNILVSQIIQYTIEELIVNIVVNDKFLDKDEIFLIKEIQQRLNSTVKLSINRVREENIIKTSKNKYKLIVSHLNK
ncbi:phenylacetate--CoA ligase family protein [Bizionia gelidisalsuginis]|uniref:Phenylacetate--CoA ligase family protein n=1 Tax=Bizionia gelidisalsuginis TaxID=291188 RepID=A0ABY3MCM3_9FLAO|nr:phenylacetate--CoA ligase family protein [Bizionia gelidisalsuginis]TYC15654.1 phenylacetate--CoA ligase family protein [Bizionia gelidisalsuginis]